MKICSPQLGISPNSMLGGEIYDYKTLKGFASYGHKVYIYVPRDKPIDKSIKNFYYSFSIWAHVFPPIIFSFISLVFIFSTYRKEKFDVLRIHSARYLGLLAIMFHLFYPKVPILVSEVTPNHSKIYYVIEYFVYKISKAIIVQSNYMKRLLIEDFQVNAEKIFVTYGGNLDNTNFKVTSKHNKNREFQLLYIGVLEKRKNPAFLIKVLEEVSKLKMNVKLIFIGSGSEKGKLIKLVKKSPLRKNVTFIGKAFGKAKYQWLASADVFLLPSLNEGFGLALTEAMTFAKPCIVSNIEPFKEIISNGRDGYTLPLKPKLWAKHIEAFYKKPIFKHKIGSNARKKVQEKFNWNLTYKLNNRVIKGIVK